MDEKYFIKDMIQPAYYEDVRAWILSNMEVTKTKDIPHIFGENTPLQWFLERDVERLLGLGRKAKSGREIVINTEDLKNMLDLAKKYSVVRVYDYESNTDGEGVWHCDVYFADSAEDVMDDNPAENYSFNEAKGE